MSEYLVSSWWNGLKRIGRCDLVRRHVSLGWASKFQKPMPFLLASLCFVLLDRGVNSQLLPKCLAYLPAAVFPTMMVMDATPREL